MAAIVEFLCYRYKKLPHEIGELDIDQINALLAGREEWESVKGEQVLDEDEWHLLGLIK